MHDNEYKKNGGGDLYGVSHGGVHFCPVEGDFALWIKQQSKSLWLKYKEVWPVVIFKFLYNLLFFNLNLFNCKYEVVIRLYNRTYF